MITTDLDELSRELAEVRDWRDELIVRLTQAMAELQSAGKAPPAELLHSIREYRRRFESLEQDMQSVQELRAQPPAAGLDAWDRALQRIARDRRLSALFQEVRRIEFRGDDATGLLPRIFAEVNEIQQATRHGADGTSDELIAGRHPLTALLGLIRGGDDLADEVWTELQDRVAAHYGREVSTAVARGRLRLAEAGTRRDPEHAIEVMA